MTPAASHRTGGSGTRSTAEERRDEVVAAAIEVFAVHGFAAASTEAIAARVGVSQPYLFRLFGTKQQLFLAAVKRTDERIAQAFADAARTSDSREPMALLQAMGLAYHALLADRSLLRVQLHAFALAAGDEPTVTRFVRDEYAALISLVADLSGLSERELRPFFAEGMLIDVAAALNLTDAVEAWDDLCLGGSAQKT